MKKWVEMKEQGVYPQGVAGPARTLPLQCYDPVNLQTQRLACNGRFPNAYSAELAGQVGLQAALQHLREAWIVGILEAYTESICLFHVKVRGKLPVECVCADGHGNKTVTSSTRLSEKTGSAIKRQLHHINHGLGEGGRSKSSLDDAAPHVLEDLAKLIQNDRQLYNAGLDRFIEDVRQAEALVGRSFLCRDLSRV